MTKYNLSDNVDDDFQFDIVSREKQTLDFVMRYPYVDEIEHVQEINDRLRDKENERRIAVNEKREEDAAQLQKDIDTINKEFQGFMYQFISPLGHEQPFKDVMNKLNIKVMRNFNNMIRKELSLE